MLTADIPDVSGVRGAFNTLAGSRQAFDEPTIAALEATGRAVDAPDAGPGLLT
ncbi:hypothetical protein [Sorangium cellulosum]|uniref:Uncharacterized protein n=1 Tax=Sorangium cellulosum So0157-2 TaxID=1254432 RepID=S4YF27_SORCE|nr:hypothetical protein [Sorangium cellulosum]AGP41488.1 hypothetical protein SCE1572_47600 [Sorangium cellulosum So0157-2]